ncbi:MAG TPA: carboxylating nicotinate-nucleotide diphosphorylase [Methylophilaceae bacterium]
MQFMLPAAIAISQQVSAALAEDMGAGDLTAQLIAADKLATAQVICRESAVLCGSAWFEACFHHLHKDIKIEWLAHEGDGITPNQKICELRGNARAILSGERCALNFLQALSATATLTRQYAEAIADTKAVVMDTRKTMPGLRLAQKYAVTVGGGANQRIGLFDGILIKENHIAAAGSIEKALAEAEKHNVPVQIEVESLEQLEIALRSGATLILLDNFDLTGLRKAVALTGDRAQLEASGGITLANIRAVAETGVHRISVGSLTKDIRTVDFSMRIVV